MNSSTTRKPIWSNKLVNWKKSKPDRHLSRSLLWMCHMYKCCFSSRLTNASCSYVEISRLTFSLSLSLYGHTKSQRRSSFLSLLLSFIDDLLREREHALLHLEICPLFTLTLHCLFLSSPVLNWYIWLVQVSSLSFSRCPEHRSRRTRTCPQSANETRAIVRRNERFWNGSLKMISIRINESLSTDPCAGPSASALVQENVHSLTAIPRWIHQFSSDHWS